MSYSKLYIDTNSSLKEVSAYLDDHLAESFYLYNEYQLSLFDRAVFKNENFNPYVKTGFKSCGTEARYYVEIGDEDGENTDNFKNGLVNLIIKLRSKFGYVVASCDFEDFIFEKTGWNWTEDSPFPS